MQKHRFYRCFLIEHLCNQALNSGADDFKDHRKNDPNFNENGPTIVFQNLFFFVPMASAAVVGLDFGAIWNDFWVHVATILGPKVDTEAS